MTSTAARVDAEAFARIYAEHHDALSRYCRSIVRDEEDARDALQSAMTKAFAALQEERRSFELRPWLFRIVHNEALSLVRRRRPTTDLDAAYDVGRDDLERTVETRERLAHLRGDLAALPERQRSALLLRELVGLSLPEIAQVLDVGERGVKQTIYEARRALLECDEGRALACEEAQQALSDGDGRTRRGRRLRAHVRSCDACRRFEQALLARPAQLQALAPPLPLAAAGGLLAAVTGGSAAAVGGATAGGSAAIAGGGAAVGGSGAALAGGGAAVAGTAAGAGLLSGAAGPAVALLGAGAALAGGTALVDDDASRADRPPAITRTVAAPADALAPRGGPGAPARPTLLLRARRAAGLAPGTAVAGRTLELGSAAASGGPLAVTAAAVAAAVTAVTTAADPAAADAPGTGGHGPGGRGGHGQLVPARERPGSGDRPSRGPGRAGSGDAGRRAGSAGRGGSADRGAAPARGSTSGHGSASRGAGRAGSSGRHDRDAGRRSSGTTGTSTGRGASQGGRASRGSASASAGGRGARKSGSASRAGRATSSARPGSGGGASASRGSTGRGSTSSRGSGRGGSSAGGGRTTGSSTAGGTGRASTATGASGAQGSGTSGHGSAVVRGAGTGSAAD